ncbi:MAG: tRNA lysidine(34) synthetase TilS [Fibrobacter sp.]|nr:tRNA lysidine(34) synthetase TilS [Fibrobacter sp.]
MNISLADIKETIQRNGWKNLLLAVSGGLDSMCLAHYFICNKDSLGIEWLGIAHVHHGLREGSADLDAELVREFAEMHCVPFFLKKLDGTALKAAEGSLENNAREARYQALKSIVFELQDKNYLDCHGFQPRNDMQTVIVTAHHGGDQAETIYLRMRRGVTLAGLRGIQAVREGRDGSPWIFRPFLNISREELTKYAKDNDINWREDESNSDTKFARNQIRHQALPNLEREIPGACAGLCRIAQKATPAYEKVMAVADKLFSPMVVSKENGLTLDTKKAKVSLKGGVDEIFRLWLDRQGFRFPIGCFKGKGFVSEIRNLSYRTRFIVKNRHIIRIYDKRTAIDI